MAHLNKKQGLLGTTVVEMALVIPLLFLLTLAVMEYGWMFMKIHEVTNAARQGARVAVLPFATNGDVLAAISALMDSADLRDSGYSVAFDPLDVSSSNSRQTLRVKVSVPYGNITLLNVPLVPVPQAIHASVAMAKEGP